jgi:hypothetical protein
VPSVLEHSAFLLKNDVFASGLLVGVVNEYDLQRILQRFCTSSTCVSAPGEMLQQASDAAR